MSRFKIGQTVVAIRNHSKDRFKIGDEFIVDGFNCCQKCGLATIFLKEKTELSNSSCDCGHIQIERENYCERSFAPLYEITDAIENLMKETNLVRI